MSNILEHFEESGYRAVAEIKYHLRNKTRPELIAFYYFLIRGNFQPGPAFIITKSREKLPVVMGTFSGLSSGVSLAEAIKQRVAGQVIIKVHGMDYLEDNLEETYQLVQE